MLVLKRSKASLESGMKSGLFLAALILERVIKVRWQDQESLNEADSKRNDQNDRKYLEHSADLACHKGQWANNEDCRQEGGNDAWQYLPCAVYGCFQLTLAPLEAGADIFRYDDRVVHQEAGGDNEPNHGHGVERIAQPLHGENCTQEGDRQSHGNPEAVAQGEEDPHGQEHENKPLYAVVCEDPQPVDDVRRHILRDIETDTRRGAGTFAFQNGIDEGLDLQGILIGRLGNFNQGGTLAVESDFVLGKFESLGDGCDVFSGERCRHHLSS